MAIYNSNLLPGYTSWDLVNASVDTSEILVIAETGGSAVYTYDATEYAAQATMLITCASCTGIAFFHVAYASTDASAWYNHSMRIPEDGLSLVISLQEATTNQVLFTVTSHNGATVASMSAQLVEQAISGVDIEYASGTSNTTPPTDGWSTTAPQWESGKYIWQRTATTFEDGHVEYSSPACIQDTQSAGIASIVEQYYLSTSNTEPIGGEWSSSQVTWESGKYIWTRSEITWTNQDVTYTDAVLAQALNQANETAKEAVDAVDALDKDLSQEGVFNRLTNNGESQGLYLEDGNVYVNATYIRSGSLEVLDSSGNTLFKADMESNSVYLAGFVAADTSIYYTRTSLDDTNKGTYLGIDGLSVAGTVDLGWRGTYDLFLNVSAGAITGGVLPSTSTSTATGAIAFTDDSLIITDDGYVGIEVGTWFAVYAGELESNQPLFECSESGWLLRTPDNSCSFSNNGLYLSEMFNLIPEGGLSIAQTQSGTFYKVPELATMRYLNAATWEVVTYSQLIATITYHSVGSAGYFYSWTYYTNVTVVDNLDITYTTRSFMHGLNYYASDSNAG